MFAQMIAIVMLAAAMLGGGGAAAVYASQESLPGEALYPLKTWSEDMRIDLINNPESELQLNLQFAERRMTEIGEVAGQDDDLAAQTVLRLQNHLNQALEATGKVSQEQALPAMQRVRQILENQQHLMQQSMAEPSPANEPVMVRSRQMLQEQLRAIENQLEEEPVQLQLQHQNQVQEQLQQQTGQQQNQQDAGGQQGKQGQQQDSVQSQDASLLQNQTQNQDQKQTNQADLGQPMNQNRLRITLTAGITPDVNPLQQGKSHGFGPQVTETPQP